MKPLHGRLALAVALAVASAGPPALGDGEGKIRVLTTTTDLREIAKEVGGDAVEVGCLMKGPEDPHFLDARPSFIRMAHDADLFVKTGMELEIGYEIPIVRDCRNARIQSGAPGYCDASEGVEKLEVPATEFDRSRGDVHPDGNPHYLMDPVRAKAVAGTIAGKLAGIDPARQKEFLARAREFARRVDAAMFGGEILKEAPARRLEGLLADGKLAAWLKEKGLEGKLAGWAKEMLPFSGAPVVDYHANLTYFADRFHLVVAAHLEPKPGIAPTPRHVRSIVERMKAEGIRVVGRTVFQPAETAASVAADAGARAVTYAHMPGALPGTDDYLSFVGANVKAFADALRQAPAAR